MIENLNKNEATALLKELKTYKDLKQKLWNRGIEIFKNNSKNIQTCKVEYFPSLTQDFVLEKSLEVYKNNFKINIDPENIVFVENKKIMWGLRIFFDDKMIDLSFLKYFNAFKK